MNEGEIPLHNHKNKMVKHKQNYGFGSSKFLVPTMIGAGIGASLGFISPPLSVQGAVAGASVGGWIGLRRANLRARLDQKIAHSRLRKVMESIGKKTSSRNGMNIDFKTHTIQKKWTPFEKKLINLTK